MEEEKAHNIYQKIDRQTELLEKIAESVKKTQRYILWGKIISAIKLLLILAPIILGIIYLPPYIKTAIEKLRELIPEIKEIRNIEENLPRKNSIRSLDKIFYL